MRGDVDRTDMDPFHSLLYKQTYTTTAKDWKRTLDPEKTFIWYDGFCMPKEKREQGFRMIPDFIKRCDFVIILAPGCTHFDKIDPRTGRKKNLCYRTYRQNAMCVFEMFCAFLTTKGGEQVRPALLVRSGGGTPKWISDTYDYVQAQVQDEGQGLGDDAEAYVSLGRLVLYASTWCGED